MTSSGTRLEIRSWPRSRAASTLPHAFPMRSSAGAARNFFSLSRYTDRKEAHILANRILDSVGSKPYRVEVSNADLRITCSVGWAVFPWTEIEPNLVSHDQVLVLADFALYQAKGTGRNRAVGLLPAGQTVRAGTVAPTIYINGIPASPVTTPGPSLDAISAPGQTTPSANTAAASAT